MNKIIICAVTIEQTLIVCYKILKDLKRTFWQRYWYWGKARESQSCWNVSIRKKVSFIMKRTKRNNLLFTTYNAMLWHNISLIQNRYQLKMTHEDWAHIRSILYLFELRNSQTGNTDSAQIFTTLNIDCSHRVSDGSNVTYCDNILCLHLSSSFWVKSRSSLSCLCPREILIRTKCSALLLQ